VLKIFQEAVEEGLGELLISELLELEPAARQAAAAAGVRL
jgi:hypothetical protein